MGGGPSEQALRTLVDVRGLTGRVVFTGRVPHADVQRYYQLIDVLAYPRHRMRLTEIVTPLKPLEAMAQGFQEVLEEDYLQYRIRSVAYLGEHLLAAGVPIVEPPGGHAVYIDAAAFLAHIPPSQFPGQALVCALYRNPRYSASAMACFLLFAQA